MSSGDVKGAEGEFAPKIKDQILKLYRDNWTDFQSAFNTKVAATNIESDFFLIRAWKESYNLAMRQLEEMFCDFMAIFIFGASFFYSFRYLISPSLGYKRSAPNPSIAKRAEYMLLAAAHHGITNVGDFAASFNEKEIDRNMEARFVLAMADKATSLLVRDLIPLVEKYRGKAECFKDGTDHETSGKGCLVDLVPIATINSVSAIINAGWSLRLGLKSWDIAKDINDENERNKEKLRVLRDLILKSLEVYEYRKRMEKGNATGRG